MNAAVLALGGGGGIFVVFLGFARNAARSASTADIVAQRLQVYGGEKPLTMDEIELQKPFSERALRPMIERLGALLSRSTPEVARKNLQNQLDLAGRPGNLTPEDFGAVRIVAAAVMAAIGLLVGLLLGSPVYTVVALAVGALVGLFLPSLWLEQKGGGRRKGIQQG